MGQTQKIDLFPQHDIYCILLVLTLTMSSIANTPIDVASNAAAIEPLPSSPQAMAVITNLRDNNVAGYEKLQTYVKEQIDGMDWSKGSISFSVDAQELGIDEICCSATLGGVRSLFFTRISELKPWSLPQTGMNWRLGAKTMFGHEGTKMVPVQTLIIDIKKVGDKYLISNITYPPKTNILKTKSGRAVNFSHLVSAVSNPKETDMSFNLNGRGGISIKSGLGMCDLVLNQVFQEDGDFVRLGDYAVELAKNCIMPPADISLSSIYDIDMDEIRSHKCECETSFVDDNCWCETLPFMTTVPGTNGSFKSFGDWRNPYEPLFCHDEDEVDLAEIDYNPDEDYFKPNIILTLDGADKGNKNDVEGGTGHISTDWTEDPNIWEMLIADFAGVCARTI